MTPRVITLPPGIVVVRVRCERQTHIITWHAGQLEFYHHLVKDLLFTSAMTAPNRCAEVLCAIRDSRRWCLLPNPLRQTLQQYKQARELRGHGAGGNPQTLWINTRAKLRGTAISNRFAPFRAALGDQAGPGSRPPDDPATGFLKFLAAHAAPGASPGDPP